ncbi:MAG: hypothetical protein ACXAEN_25610 [Candidatus Thorarchaeota archaeon]|jgi:uncharacterized protein with PIN domain
MAEAMKVDDEEVQCVECKRTVDLYAEEVYHKYVKREHLTPHLEWVCKQCNLVAEGR